ncbi:hypothetical protein ACFLQ0_03760 [Nitrospinota bacterium]
MCAAYSALPAAVGREGAPERAANFTLAGDDMRTLFISACTSLCRVRVKVPGVKLF